MRMRWPLLITTLTLVTACGENEQNLKLADAQSCMNDSTPATVSSCMSKLEGVSGERADLMRCGIKFMEEGFDQSDRLVNVMEQLENTTGNPTLAAMAFLAFRQANTEAENLENAELAKSYCAKTNAQGFIKLADLSYIATSMTNLASVASSVGLSPGQTPTEAQLKQLLDVIAGPTTPDEVKAAAAAKEAIGQTALETHETSCKDQENPDQFCRDISAAITQAGSSDPALVADALLSRLNQ